MSSQSDITIDVAKFDPANVTSKTKALNQDILAKLENAPGWYEVGAPVARQARLEGKGPFPPPKELDEALDINIPSREDGREIPLRLVYPSQRKSNEERKQCNGVVYHIHGGGWVLGDHKSADPLLQLYADVGDLAVVSVGYRLAPEHPYPAPVDDCFDAAEWLVKNAESRFGGPLKFITGESAGAHLSAVATFHLLRTIPDFILQGGLILNYGCFDLSGTPSSQYYPKPLVLNTRTINEFVNAFLPGVSTKELKDPKISPLYEDFNAWRGKLPPALFTIGTEDALVDDTLFMSAKWSVAGAETVVKVYEGAPHGYTAFAASGDEVAQKALGDIAGWIKGRLTK